MEPLLCDTRLTLVILKPVKYEQPLCRRKHKNASVANASEMSALGFYCDHTAFGACPASQRAAIRLCSLSFVVLVIELERIVSAGGFAKNSVRIRVPVAIQPEFRALLAFTD